MAPIMQVLYAGTLSIQADLHNLIRSGFDRTNQ
jgi:hypothetical protein